MNNTREDLQQYSWQVTIPYAIFADDRLSDSQKMLYMRISGLCRQHGYCWATNKYLAKQAKIEPETASRWVSKLKECGYIQTKNIYAENSKQILERRIYLTEALALLNLPIDPEINTPLDPEINRGIDPRIKENALSFNNTHTLKEKNKKESSGEPAPPAGSAESACALLDENLPAGVFASALDVALDAKTAGTLNKRIPAALLALWRRVCEDHYLNFDDAQRKSERYRRNSLKFLLDDFERKRRREEQENLTASAQTSKRANSSGSEKKQHRQKDEDDGLPNNRKLTFGERMEREKKLNFDWNDEMYQRWKDNWVMLCNQQGKPERIKEIDEYEYWLKQPERIMAAREAEARAIPR